MVPVMTITMARTGGHDPRGAPFWFVMSMSLLAGFVAAYPVNWWLVSTGLKHGMMTVRPATSRDRADEPHAESAHKPGRPPLRSLIRMTLLSLLLFGAGIVVSVAAWGL